MPIELKMPALSPTMEEGTLAKWLVKEGDEVKSGDILAEIETDKATMEFEAVDEGKIAKILVPEGTDGVKVGQPIAILAGDGEQISSPSVEEVSDTRETPEPASTETPAIPAPASQQDEATPTPHVFETAARDLVADVAHTRDEPEVPEGTPLVSMTVREALRDAMAEEMRGDDRVFVIGEEVAEYQGAYKVTQNLLQEFGAKRVVDTPITEHGFAGLGVGAAMAGLRPIVEFMTFNFAMQAIDHIINSAAKTLYMSGGQMDNAVVFRGPNGAAARVAAQHSQDYSCWYSNVPGLKVVAPYTAADFKGLLKSAIRDSNPIVSVENGILYGQQFEVPRLDDFVVPIGKARIARKGKDVTLVAWSIGMTYAIKAADELAKEGIEAEIIDLRTIRPMDVPAIIRSVQKTHRCVTVEEGWPQSGVGAEIAAKVMTEAFDYLDAPVIRITGKDVPMPYAANLEKLALPKVKDDVEAAT